MYGQTLKLYHCNTRENICNAVLTKDYSALKSNNDRFWVGNGIYFWDNLSNAKYWKREKERKNNSDIEFCIGSGMVKLDNLFDLTDSDIRKDLEKVFESYYEVNPKLEERDFGEKMNFYMNEEPTIKDKYDVIKVHGNYPRQNTKLYRYDQFKVGLTPQVKTIYNVINDSAILEFKEEVG